MPDEEPSHLNYGGSVKMRPKADGTCRSVSVFSVPPNPDIHREVKATYTQTGAELTMQWEGAGMTKGRLKGSEFTMNNEGMIFFYRK